MILQHIKDMPEITQSEGAPLTSDIELAKKQLGMLSQQEQDATEVALAYANLGRLLGWSRMRRSISEYRRQSGTNGRSPNAGQE